MTEQSYQRRQSQWSRLCILCCSGNGTIQWCLCTDHCGTDLAAPGTHWCLKDQGNFFKWFALNRLTFPQVSRMFVTTRALHLTTLMYFFYHNNKISCLNSMYFCLTSTVCGVSRSKWAHLLVLYGAGEWAQLTLGPPASTRIAAALRLGHAVPVSWRLLAHCWQSLCVTEAFSVVFGNRMRETPHTNRFIWDFEGYWS